MLGESQLVFLTVGDSCLEAPAARQVSRHLSATEKSARHGVSGKAQGPGDPGRCTSYLGAPRP